ncbi:hypothetical protein CNECB9_50002 [Cupriavidus necator]|uniref:Uncharacterized protein n=1 Tax=Cupriavidus necator TaxID=106590 RepID=A0A1K0J018_CUPNE|nr:hypothetical protein CNECB9_50002 [Cupriavidus necator]
MFRAKHLLRSTGDVIRKTSVTRVKDCNAYHKTSQLGRFQAIMQHFPLMPADAMACLGHLPAGRGIEPRVVRDVSGDRE